MVAKPFTCTEWMNWADRCDKQCNECRDLDTKNRITSWIDLEDKGIEVN
jgi:hypothetical protein